MDPGEALQHVNGLQTDPKRWEYAKSKHDELLRDSKSVSARKDTYGTAVTREKYGESGVVEYEKLVRSFLITNGYNISNAQQVAKKCLDSVYGTTNFGYYGKGKGWRWWKKMKVKYPPEAYYPSSTVRHVMVPHLRNVVIPYLRDKMGYRDLNNDNYVLMANGETVRAFYNRGADAPSPAWEIWYVTPHGDVMPVFDGDGDVVTYSIDHDTMERKTSEWDALTREIASRSLRSVDGTTSQESWDQEMDNIQQLEGEEE
jgi:hypothetical protein